MSKQSHSNPELDNVLEAGRHTPGWIQGHHVNPDGSISKDMTGVYCHTETGTKQICDVFFHANVKQAEANARLIAASPDLLAELHKAAANYLKLATEDFGQDVVASDSWIREYNRTLALIARATGEAA